MWLGVDTVGDGDRLLITRLLVYSAVAVGREVAFRRGVVEDKAVSRGRDQCSSVMEWPGDQSKLIDLV